MVDIFALPDRVGSTGVFRAAVGEESAYVDLSTATALSGMRTLETASANALNDGELVSLLIFKDANKNKLSTGVWDETQNRVILWYSSVENGTISDLDAVSVVVTVSQEAVYNLMQMDARIQTYTTSFTLDVQHHNRTLVCQAALGITLPGELPAGFFCHVIRESGTVTFTSGTDQSILGSATISTQYQQVTLYKRSTTEWVVTTQ